MLNHVMQIVFTVIIALIGLGVLSIFIRELINYYKGKSISQSFFEKKVINDYKTLSVRRDLIKARNEIDKKLAFLGED